MWSATAIPWWALLGFAGAGLYWKLIARRGITAFSSSNSFMEETTGNLSSSHSVAAYSEFALSCPAFCAFMARPSQAWCDGKTTLVVGNVALL